MKTFAELSTKQQERAIADEVSALLSDLCDGIRFNDALNGDDLQARIDAAFVKADAMATPWFAHAYIMDTCREEIEGMARCRAEDTLFYSRDQIVAREPEADNAKR